MRLTSTRAGVGGGNVTPHDKNTARLEPGHSVGEFYGSVYEGIWKSADEIKQVGTMPSAKPGDIRYKDTNGDGTYNTETDDVFLGNPNPKFNFGLTNDVSFGPLSLHVFMYGEYGNSVLNLAKQQWLLDGLGVSALRLDRWSPTNPNGMYPGANASTPQRVSSIMVEDGSVSADSDRRPHVPDSDVYQIHQNGPDWRGRGQLSGADQIHRLRPRTELLRHQ